jgi:hypothetical protein
MGTELFPTAILDSDITVERADSDKFMINYFYFLF